jgi:hypothetical protein
LVLPLLCVYHPCAQVPPSPSHLVYFLPIH